MRRGLAPSANAYAAQAFPILSFPLTINEARRRPILLDGIGTAQRRAEIWLAPYETLDSDCAVAVQYVCVLHRS